MQEKRDTPQSHWASDQAQDKERQKKPVNAKKINWKQYEMNTYWGERFKSLYAHNYSAYVMENRATQVDMRL